MEAELAADEEKQLSLEQSKAILESVGAERLSEITELQSQLEEMRVRDGLVRELKEQLASLEEQLRRLEEEVGEGWRERGMEVKRRRYTEWVRG